MPTPAIVVCILPFCWGFEFSFEKKRGLGLHIGPFAIAIGVADW